MDLRDSGCGVLLIYVGLFAIVVLGLLAIAVALAW